MKHKLNKHVAVTEEVHARLTVMKLVLGMKRYDDVLDFLTRDWQQKLEKLFKVELEKVGSSL